MLKYLRFSGCDFLIKFMQKIAFKNKIRFCILVNFWAAFAILLSLTLPIIIIFSDSINELAGKFEITDSLKITIGAISLYSYFIFIALLIAVIIFAFIKMPRKNSDKSHEDEQNNFSLLLKLLLITAILSLAISIFKTIFYFSFGKFIYSSFESNLLILEPALTIDPLIYLIGINTIGLFSYLGYKNLKIKSLFKKYLSFAAVFVITFILDAIFLMPSIIYYVLFFRSGIIQDVYRIVPSFNIGFLAMIFVIINIILYFLKTDILNKKIVKVVQFLVPLGFGVFFLILDMIFMTIDMNVSQTFNQFVISMSYVTMAISLIFFPLAPLSSFILDRKKSINKVE